MKIDNITDVFFDLDHTLWDFDKNSALTFEKIFELNKVSVNLKDFLSVYEPINLEYWKQYREERITKELLRYSRLRDTFNTVNLPIEDDIIYKLSEDYISHLTSFNHVFDGTFEILDYLKHKYRLHIITNGFDEVQHEKLKKSEIVSYFTTVTNSEMAGVKKPNPKIFQYALKKANVQSEKSIMIGDNLEADIMGAIDFGMEAICFNYHGTKLDNHIKQVTNLLDLKVYL